MRATAIMIFWLFCTPINGHKSLFILSLEDMDRRANIIGAGVFNRMLINNGYPFGDARESISSVIGKNEVDGTLTTTGKAITNFLNLFQTNHCLNSIQNF